MNTHRSRLALLTGLALALGGTGIAHADAVLIKRVQQEQGMDLPSRGMSMRQVEARYGAPSRKLSPRGGGKARQPVINRWEYPGYIVYFEHSRVIHSVLNTPAGNNTQPQQAH